MRPFEDCRITKGTSADNKPILSVNPYRRHTHTVNKIDIHIFRVACVSAQRGVRDGVRFLDLGQCFVFGFRLLPGRYLNSLSYWLNAPIFLYNLGL